MRKADGKLARAVALALGATLPVAAAAPVIADDAVTAAAVTTENGGAVVTYSRREAALASRPDASGNIPVVLHYGPDIWDADREAQVLLLEDGITAYALPGGKRGQVELFVNAKIYGQYTQSDLNTGIVSFNAARAHSIESTGVDPYERPVASASLGGAE